MAFRGVSAWGQDVASDALADSWPSAGAVRWLRFRRLGKTVHVRKASFHNARSTSMPPLQLQLCLQSMPDTKDYGNPFGAVALLMS